MIYEMSTFRQLTAPGYFDFSSQQTPKTASIVAWFNNLTKRWEDQVNLFDSTFRLWASRDYSAVTVSMPSYLLYLLVQNGIGWFRGNIAQAAALLTYFSKSYPSSTALAFQQLFTFLLTPVISWITGPGQIFFGSNSPARFAEALLIYSQAGSLPATPPPQTYTALTWDAPASWSKTAVTATFYSRGYLSGGNIVWMTPRSTSNVSIMSDAANLAGLPATPTAGDLCGVLSDGTGDQGAVYYFDGSTWRKTTTPNADQGLVIGAPPSPGSSVFVPVEGVISSSVQPPVSGPSQGYGYYGIFGNFVLQAKRIDLSLDLTTDGVANLGMIVFLLRKIKPTLNALYLNYTTPSSPNTPVSIQIFDQGAV